ILPTPLCPAGHLPRKGGDWRLQPCRPFCDVGDWRKRCDQLISPLAGEMAGRPEGGAGAKTVHPNPPRTPVSAWRRKPRTPA
ncbi:MAG: hypothetical protein EOR54_26760, partial [Mesorhizobium sp.]